jgi:large subunit ribosomal protein L4e
MAARPLVSVQTADGKGAEQLALPKVFLSPIRPDVVQFVHTNVRKNRRQAYAVTDLAGHMHSAESWGTGRAVSRIPRVSGGGTSRAGQGAFGNQCRKGRMFAPTRTWRKWHRRVNQNQKRFAVASALAASALPSLVLARGHKIERVPEIPLVVDDAAQSFVKTKQAVALLTKLGAYEDVEHSKDSRKLRAGKGKMRNRRHVQRRGPLVVYANDQGISKAFRNLPGVDLQHVDRLNLLELAPGGHLGRFVIWTKSAFSALNQWAGKKKGYELPRPIITNSDISRIINSDEVQSKLRPALKIVKRYRQKKNPLKNLGVRVRLNPFTLAHRRSELLAQEKRGANREAALKKLRAEKKALRKAHKKVHGLNFLRITREEEERKQFAEEKRLADIAAGVPASSAAPAEAKEDKKEEKGKAAEKAQEKPKETAKETPKEKEKEKAKEPAKSKEKAKPKEEEEEEEEAEKEEEEEEAEKEEEEAEEEEEGGEEEGGDEEEEGGDEEED